MGDVSGEGGAPAGVSGPDVENGGIFQLLWYIAHVHSVLGLQNTTLAGHLSAIQHFHRLSGAVELDKHRLIRDVVNGVLRGYSAIGTQQRVRRPVP